MMKSPYPILRVMLSGIGILTCSCNVREDEEKPLEQHEQLDQQIDTQASGPEAEVAPMSDQEVAEAGKTIREMALIVWEHEEVEKMFGLLNSMIRDHPDAARALLTDLIDDIEQKQAEKKQVGDFFGIEARVSNELFDIILEFDHELALRYDQISHPNGHERNQLEALRAIQADGGIARVIKFYPEIGKGDFGTAAQFQKLDMIYHMGNEASESDMPIIMEWLPTLGDEELKRFTVGLRPELYPEFDEFDDWPYKDVLGSEIKPLLARKLAVELMDLTSTEEAKAKLAEFELLPGFNEPLEVTVTNWGNTHRAILEQEWAYRLLDGDNEWRRQLSSKDPIPHLWAIEAMETHARGGVVSSIVNTVYQEQSPQEAMAYADRFSDRDKAKAADMIIHDWYRDDSKEASEFIAQMEPGELRYQAAKALVLFLNRDDHDEDAAYWERWAEEEAK